MPVLVIPKNRSMEKFIEKCLKLNPNIRVVKDDKLTHDSEKVELVTLKDGDQTIGGMQSVLSNLMGS